MKEKEWEKLLRIKTTGRDDTRSDTFRYPYEPTSYEVLERLANTGFIGKNNTLLDYGCGKGRVSIFMAYQTKCHSIGIEYDERIYNRALANKADTVSTEYNSYVKMQLVLRLQIMWTDFSFSIHFLLRYSRACWRIL